MNIKTESKYLLGFVVAFFFIVGTGVFTWVSIARLVDDSLLVNHTHEVLEGLEDIVSQLKDTETGQRGYVLTGDTAYLEPFYVGSNGVDIAFTKVKELTLDNSHQQEHLELLEPLIQTKVNELKQTIGLRTDYGLTEALAVIQTNEGKKTMDDLRLIIGDMKQVEADLLQKRAATTQSTAVRAKLTVLFGTVSAIFIFGLIAKTLLRSNAMSEQLTEELFVSNRMIVQSNESLEDRVRIRTLEFESANERAIRSEKLAIIGQLSGGIAHDLRNPMGAIKNAVFFIKRKFGAEQTAEDREKISSFLEIIDAQIDRSNDVITNLLSFGSDKPIPLSGIEVRDVIDEAVNGFVLHNDIDLSIKIDSEVSSISGNSVQLIRVLQNLLSNAQDAMQTGGDLSITAQGKENFVEIVISDTGSGIDPKHIEKIFDPLFSDKSSGTGLGLAICQDIVAKHNGSISVSSQLGVGSSFTVCLPYAERNKDFATTLIQTLVVD